MLGGPVRYGTDPSPAADRRPGLRDRFTTAVRVASPADLVGNMIQQQRQPISGRAGSVMSERDQGRWP